jgi:hypothetical protein
VDLAAELYSTVAPLLAFEERSFVWGIMEVAVEAAEVLDYGERPPATAL